MKPHSGRNARLAAKLDLAASAALAAIDAGFSPIALSLPSLEATVGQ